MADYVRQACERMVAEGFYPVTTLYVGNVSGEVSRKAITDAIEARVRPLVEALQICGNEWRWQEPGKCTPTKSGQLALAALKQFFEANNGPRDCEP